MGIWEGGVAAALAAKWNQLMGLRSSDWGLNGYISLQNEDKRNRRV